ncbi:unnamed protein product [Nippostrongylus brasiliensis]|uniref:Uncharacterized protein n=1 Tax=Nippostrongylus brasiliensis TaxID=27835 RepID=A0A0N4XWJ0_NIPBR|nr:unnamed protein product [Nippostrongylus brasiliensis]
MESYIRRERERKMRMKMKKNRVKMMKKKKGGDESEDHKIKKKKIKREEMCQRGKRRNTDFNGCAGPRGGGGGCLRVLLSVVVVVYPKKKKLRRVRDGCGPDPDTTGSRSPVTSRLMSPQLSFFFHAETSLSDNRAARLDWAAE